MDLKDLADAGEGRGVTDRPSRAVAPQVAPEPTAADSWPADLSSVRWLVLASRFLDDELILVIFREKDLKDARKANPGLVAYFPPEIEEMLRNRGSTTYAEFFREVHRVKKRFGGWIVPTGSPLARQIERSDCGEPVSRPPVHGDGPRAEIERRNVRQTAQQFGVLPFMEGEIVSL